MRIFSLFPTLDIRPDPGVWWLYDPYYSTEYEYQVIIVNYETLYSSFCLEMRLVVNIHMPFFLA